MFHWFTRVLVCLLLALVLTASAARAESDPFQSHHDRGLELYQRQEYGEAIAEFQSAFQLRQLPRLLFNMAQCHRKLGHAREALSLFERYLRVATAVEPKHRRDVELSMVQMRELLQASDAPHEPPKDEPKTPLPKPPEPSPVDPTPPLAPPPLTKVPLTPAEPVAPPPPIPSPPPPPQRPEPVRSVTQPKPPEPKAPTSKPAFMPSATPPLTKPAMKPARSRRWIGITVGVLAAGAAAAGATVLTLYMLNRNDLSGVDVREF